MRATFSFVRLNKATWVCVGRARATSELWSLAVAKRYRQEIFQEPLNCFSVSNMLGGTPRRIRGRVVSMTETTGILALTTCPSSINRVPITPSNGALSSDLARSTDSCAACFCRLATTARCASMVSCRTSLEFGELPGGQGDLGLVGCQLKTRFVQALGRNRVGLVQFF